MNNQKKPQICDASTQTKKTQDIDISGSKDGRLAVDERLAKLMLIQSNTFKSKSEIECGMRDIFKKDFGMIGSVQCLRHLIRLLVFSPIALVTGLKMKGNLAPGLVRVRGKK